MSHCFDFPIIHATVELSVPASDTYSALAFAVRSIGAIGTIGTNPCLSGGALALTPLARSVLLRGARRE